MRALRLAGRLAPVVGAELTVAHVAPPDGARSLSLVADPPPIRRRQQQIAEGLMEDCARRAEVVPARLLPLSHPSASIALAQVTRRAGAALLVVG